MVAVAILQVYFTTTIRSNLRVSFKQERWRKHITRLQINGQVLGFFIYYPIICTFFAAYEGLEDD